MARIITLKLKQEDLDYARTHGFKNAVLRSLSMRSNTLWRMTDCGTGIELVPPYDTIKVCPADVQKWREWQQHIPSGACALHLMQETLSSSHNKETKQ